VVALVDSLGTGLFLAGSALFFNKVLGLTPPEVGLGLSLAGFAGLLTQVPVGRLADRVGGVRVLIGLNLWRAACFLVYPFVSGLWMFIIVACAAGAGESAPGPVTQAVLGSVESETSRVRLMATIGTARNIGFAVGALLATLAIATNSDNAYRALLLADAASFVVSAILLVRLPLPRTPQPQPTARPSARRGRLRVHSPRFILLSLLNGGLYLHTVLLSVGIPLWIASSTKAPSYVAGAVIVVNTVMAMTLQVWLSRGAGELKPAAARQRWAGLLLAVCCLLVAMTTHTSPLIAVVLLVAAGVALTLGEIWQMVGAWGISYAMSPQENRSYHLSVYNLAATGATVVGPAIVTTTVIEKGVSGWIGLAVVFATIGMAIPLLVRRGTGTPDTPTTADAVASAP
jgi:Major Facilitator Superfamily